MESCEACARLSALLHPLRLSSTTLMTCIIILECGGSAADASLANMLDTVGGEIIVTATMCGHSEPDAGVLADHTTAGRC